jgi:phosphoribosylglycinamide formyltransferase-1
MMRIGFLASGRGSNMQAVMDACKNGTIEAVPAVVISNNSRSGALDRASREGVPGRHLSSATHPDPVALDGAILDTLRGHGVDLIMLAGYMKKLGPRTLRHFKNRVLNIHPALLPKHGGKGMYGLRVHEAVLAAGDRETGVSIHIVDEEYDRGAVIAQRRVPVQDGDTPEVLAARVLEQEHGLLVETLAKVASGELALPT